jgi:hypothetical protein
MRPAMPLARRNEIDPDTPYKARNEGWAAPCELPGASSHQRPGPSGFVDVQAARPDLAAVGRALFYNFGIGLGFLARVRPDGGPRVHPISVIVTSHGLYGFILPGPKLNDLRRDGRYALHSETIPPPRQDAGFYVTGGAIEISDANVRELVAA